MSGRSPASAQSSRVPQRRSAVGAATRQRIMQEAERLIGEDGFNAVSIRDITTAADCDVSAIHYHFGSKQDLVTAILEQRLTELNGQRAPLLDALLDAPQPTVDELARSLVMPAVAHRRDAKRRNAFISAAIDQPEFARVLARALDPEISRYMLVLQRMWPDVAPAALVTRLLFAITLVQSVLTNHFPGRQPWLKRYGDGTPIDQTEELVSFVSAAFSGLN